MESIMCNQNRKVEHMPAKKRGRPYVYKDREVICISLPKKARAQADELRGKQPLATYLTELICEKLGVDDFYVEQ